jgi:enoyl-CoA hydratase/carnithine racemase
MFVPTTIDELGALMTDLEADPSVKVVVFQSANPEYFIAHLDVYKAAERPEVLGLRGFQVITLVHKVWEGAPRARRHRSQESS